MQDRNHMFGWLRSLFSTEEELKETQYDALVSFENYNREVGHTFEETITRTVSLLHFAQGGSLVVEHDQTEESGRETVFRSFTDFEGSGKGLSEDMCARLVYGNVVSTVNDMAVAHREEIGEIEVTVRRSATLELTYDRLIEEDSDIPADVRDDEAIPSLYKGEFVTENGNAILRRWTAGRGFERFNGEVVFDRYYRFEEWNDEVTIEADREMGDVLAEAIAGRTEDMRAVSATGDVLLADSDGTMGDIVQVQSLPSGERSGDR